MPDAPITPPYAPPLPPLVTLGGAPIYCTGEESLLLTAYNAAAGVTVTVYGRTQALELPRPSTFTLQVKPAANRTVAQAILNLPAGWLYSANAVITGGTPAMGQCWVKLSIVHGSQVTSPEIFVLASGYITTISGMSYPGGNVSTPIEGGGYLRAYQGNGPAAGGEVGEAVPASARWQLISFYTTLTTSATAGNRRPSITLDDGSFLLWKAIAPADQAASLTVAYQIGESGFISAGGLAAIVLPAPCPTWLSGYAGSQGATQFKIRTSTAGILAGDQWSAPLYLVREFLDVLS